MVNPPGYNLPPDWHSCGLVIPNLSGGEAAATQSG